MTAEETEEFRRLVRKHLAERPAVALNARSIHAAVSRELRGVTAPTGAAVLTSFVPALAAALDGAGPALLPLPTGGRRGDVLAAMDTSQPLERDSASDRGADSCVTHRPLRHRKEP